MITAITPRIIGIQWLWDQRLCESIDELESR